MQERPESKPKVKTIYVKPVMSKEKALSMIGTFYPEHTIQQLVTEDADVFNEEDGQPLIVFRKQIVGKELAKKAWESLRVAATLSENRGNAADGSSGYVRNKTRRYKPVHSGIIGYYDRYIRIPYCRQTAFNEKQLDKFKAAYPYIKMINDLFKTTVTERYKNQLEIIQNTHPDFYIHDTVFTTVTVNKNYRTALHVDKGDFKNGFGNLGVLSAGRYKGAFTCMPRFAIGVDVRSRDIACFDVHEVHGNTEFVGSRFERISVVCYYRENMYKCGSAS